MFFLLSTPDLTKLQSNTIKVKVHLRNGIAEIFDQHQDLMGRIENDLLEIETNFENKLEKFLYILQDGVFIVSTKGLENKEVEKKGTGVYVYARRVREVNQNTSIDEIEKAYQQKNEQLEKEIEKLENLKAENEKTETLEKKKNKTLALSSKTLLLKQEVEFLKRASKLIKKFKS
jgi:F0F1-type ATP synthase epsilon subunit